MCFNYAQLEGLRLLVPLVYISNLVQHEESIQFIVTERLKTSRPGKPSVIVIFPSVPSKPRVCPMITVSVYITRTCNLRNPTDFRLFISFVKPHRAVSPATISRWIKTVLSDAGIDTSIFKAHSVRGLQRRQLTTRVCPKRISLNRPIGLMKIRFVCST